MCRGCLRRFRFVSDGDKYRLCRRCFVAELTAKLGQCDLLLTVSGRRHEPGVWMVRREIDGDYPRSFYLGKLDADMVVLINNRLPELADA